MESESTCLMVEIRLPCVCSAEKSFIKRMLTIRMETKRTAETMVYSILILHLNRLRFQSPFVHKAHRIHCKQELSALRYKRKNHILCSNLYI